MERIKHHYCWVKAVRAESAPVGGGTVQAPGEIPLGMAAAWMPGPGGGSGPIVVAPNYSTVEPIALDARSLPPISPHFATVQPDALHDEQLKALPAGVLSAMKAAAVPYFATVEPMVLPDASLQPLSPEVVSAMAIAAAPFFATVPPQDLATGPLGAVSAADVPVAAHGSAVELDFGTVPPRRMSAADVPPVGPATPLLFAGATFAGAWQFEPSSGGAHARREGGIGLVFQPIIGSRQDALAWRDSAAGQRWSQDALAITLMSFAAIGEL